MPVFIQDHPPKPLPVSGTSYLYSATSGLRNPSLPVCECSPSHQGSPQQLPQGCVPGHVPGIPEPAWQQLLPVPSPALGSNCPVNGFPIFFQDRGLPQAVAEIKTKLSLCVVYCTLWEPGSPGRATMPLHHARGRFNLGIHHVEPGAGGRGGSASRTPPALA